MVLMKVLWLLTRILSGQDPQNSLTAYPIPEKSPINHFLSESHFSVGHPHIPMGNLGKDTQILQNYSIFTQGTYKSYVFQGIILMLLLIISASIGFFHGYKEKKNDLEFDENSVSEDSILLRSPSSKGSTIVSSMPSPNYIIDASDPEPFSLLFSHQTFDNLINNGGYKKNFSEEGLLWEDMEESVYLARHKLDNQLYLIKSIPLSINLGDNLGNKKLFQEINKIKKLDCRHIARYVTCWVESEEVYLSSVSINILLYVQMEYINGMPLSEWLIQRFDKEIAIKAIKQICKVMQYLHYQGIPHGDISLSNVFLDAYGSVTIGDFNFKNCMCIDKENFLAIVAEIIKFFKGEEEDICKRILEFEYIFNSDLKDQIKKLFS